MRSSTRTILTALAALVLLLGSTTAASGHGKPVLQVDPAVAAAGGTITCKGSQMKLEAEFTVTLERAGKSVTLGMATATSKDPLADDGGFAATFTIPKDTAPGSYQVRATMKDGTSAVADLTVTDASSTASNATAMQMASGELHALDRSKPRPATVGLGVLSGIVAVAGLWLARRKEDDL